MHIDNQRSSDYFVKSLFSFSLSTLISKESTNSNGEIREKPENAEECRRFLRSYKDGPATCVASIVVTNTKTKKTLESTQTASVFFRPIIESRIEELIKQGDVLKCAGGFTIEHMENELEKIEGEESVVKGMSKKEVARLIEEVQKD